MFVRLSLFSLLVNSFLYSMKNDEPIIVPCSIHFTRSFCNYLHKDFNNRSLPKPTSSNEKSRDEITEKAEFQKKSNNQITSINLNSQSKTEKIIDLKNFCHNQRIESEQIMELIENNDLSPIQTLNLVDYLKKNNEELLKKVASTIKSSTIQGQSQELRENVQKFLNENNLKDAKIHLNELQLLEFPSNELGFSAHKKAISKFKKKIEEKSKKTNKK